MIIHFTRYLLICGLNCSAFYKASTTTQIPHKTEQIHKNDPLNRQNKTTTTTTTTAAADNNNNINVIIFRCYFYLEAMW